MDGWNYIVLYTVVACFAVPFLVRLAFPRTRALWVATSCITAAFILAWIGWLSVELALLTALLAAIPAFIGAGLGALARELVR